MAQGYASSVWTRSLTWTDGGIPEGCETRQRRQTQLRFPELLLSFRSGLIQSGAHLLGGTPVDPRREWRGVMDNQLLAPGSLR